MPKRIQHQPYVIDNFMFGMDWTSPPYQIGPGWVAEAKNVNLDYFKAMKKRGGCSKLYAEAFVSGYPIKSIYEYSAPDGNQYLLVTADTNIGYYDSGWVNLQTTLTSGTPCHFVTHLGYCFGVNGVDNNFKIYNTVFYDNVGIAAPAAAPETALGVAGDLTGEYQYVYAYKRSGPTELISNYSPVSTPSVSPSSQKVDVSYLASLDPQVDKIVIYRTLDLAGETSTEYFKVVELDNEDGTYPDNINDNNLTTSPYSNHTPPPKSKFIEVYKNRTIFANCPDETDGESLFLYSIVNEPECCPSSNYQYFDREDGNPITAIGALTDYLVVFKKNKIAVMEGEFTQWYPISAGVGSISPYIIKYEDKILFLSEEGWKVTDGRKVYDVGKRLGTLVLDNYFTVENGENFSCAYYPMKHQVQFLLYSSTLTNMILCGHWLAQLYSEVEADFGTEALTLGWTYHYYQNQSFTMLGNYTDSEGIQRIVAGDLNGYIYLLDDGTTDDGYDIEIEVSTGWLNFNVPTHVSKTLRWITPVYKCSGTSNAKIYYDFDWAASGYYVTLPSAVGSYSGEVYAGSTYPGLEGITGQNLDVNSSATGRVFRFRCIESTSDEFILISIGAGFRLEGVR